MRKDMRMGFGVGGVLLAVIIVAILVIHRNQGKQVASLDKTGTATSESTTIGPNDSQPGTPTPDAQPDLKPADPLPLVAKAEAKVPDPKIPGVADDSIKSDGTQWDRLFASSSDAQPKSQLRRPKLNQPPVTDAQPSDTSAHVAEVAPKHDADNAIAASEKVPGSSKPSHSTADATGAREHVVKSGESFYTIAKTAYGDGKHYKELQAANPSIDSGKLHPGMTIKIPALATFSKPTSEAKTNKPVHTGGIPLSARTTTTTTTGGTAADGKTYTVKSGDSLYKIARDLCGSGERMDEIYTLNRDVIGNDSTKLKIGQVLKLPAKSTAAAASAR